MDFGIAIVGAGLSGQQAGQLALGDHGPKPGQVGLGFGDAGRVVLGRAQLDQGQRVLQALLEAAVLGDRLVEARALAHDLLGGLGIVPEVGVLGAEVQRLQALERGIQVKEASSAGSATG